MQVVAVVPLDKRRSKVLVDEDFAFVLYKGELRRYHIEEGGELSQEQYEEILQQVLNNRAKERALYLLKASDKTTGEIRRKLQEGFYPQEAIEFALEFLEKYHLVDDMDYGRRYIEAYKDRRSKKRLQFDLQQKGLDRQQISELLESAEVSEDEQIQAFLQKKGYPSGEMPLKERGKLVSALCRKGFSYDAIYRAMGDMSDWD